MSLSGTLQDFDISNIFLLIEQDSKSGKLIISTAEGKTIVIFKNGMVVNITSESEDIKVFVFRFLHMVKGYSPMETKELDTLFYNNIHLLSDELVKKGYLSVQELTTIVQTALVDITCGVFALDEGKYLFEPAPSVDEFQYLSIAVPSNFVMLEAARRNDEWVNIGTIITPETIFGGNIHITPAQVHQPLSNFSLYSVAFVDGKRTVSEVCDMVFFSKFHVYKAMDESLREGKISLINRPDNAPLPSTINSASKQSGSEAVMDSVMVAFSSIITTVLLITLLIVGYKYYHSKEMKTQRHQSYTIRHQNSIHTAKLRKHCASMLYMGINGTSTAPNINNLYEEKLITKRDKELSAF